MKKKNVKVFWLIVAFALFVSATGATYAWYLSRDKGIGDTQMGVVDIAIDKAEHNISPANSTINFAITSQSNIDYFLRMPYSLIFKDSTGEDMPQNTPKDLVIVEITSLNIGSSSAGLSPSSVTTFISNGYEKQGIEMLSGRSGGYLVFPSAEGNITGQIRVSFNTAKYPEYFSGGVLKDNLYLTIIPEAIQGTKKAVESNFAKESGWNPAKVVEEAKTVVDDNTL